MTKLLIDGDMLVHRSTAAVEKDTRFLDRYHILFSDFETALNVFEETLGELLDSSGCDDPVFAFSDPVPENNFRRQLVGDDYKSNRAGSRKPLAYWDLKAHCEREYACLETPTLEADDVIGINATLYPDTYVIWSLDKDLRQIPGKHLRDDEVITVSEADGYRFFLP